MSGLMSRARLELALAVGAALLCVAAAERWSRAIEFAAPQRVNPPAAAPQTPAHFDLDSLEHAADATVAHDPFRLANAPASVRYEPRRASAPPVPAAPRIALVLKAIVGGPPWQAIIDGIPGQSGAVVRAGDAFDKLVIRRVTRDTVVVQGPDTTWKLTLQRE